MIRLAFFMHNRLTYIYLLLLLVAPAAHAQDAFQTPRSYFPSVQALGMGDAPSALPSPGTAFFYNPAHFAEAPFLRPVISFAGVQGGFSDNFRALRKFYSRELQPAIDDGLDTLNETQLQALYDEAVSLGQDGTYLHAGIRGPSIVLNTGLAGIGGGIWANGFVRAQVTDAGAGIPQVDLIGIGDIILAAGGGLGLGVLQMRGLSVGALLKFTQRSVIIKQKPLDLITSDEPIHVLTGSSVGFDFGFVYEPPFLKRLPGHMNLSWVIYDVGSQNFDYAYDRTLEGTFDQVQALNEVRIANEILDLSPSYRLGIGYVFPGLFGLFNETGIAIDYLGYSNPTLDQAFLTNLRVGAQVSIPFFSFRAGYNQGYPSYGVGFSLGFITLEYAYYGVEYGRIPGQIPSYKHAFQLGLGIF